MNMLVSAWRRRAWICVSEQDGLASVEYAVVLALFVVAALGAIRVLGGTLTTTFSTISDNVPDASQGGPRGPTSGTFDPVYVTTTHLPPPSSTPNP